ncbi:Origin recognition complex subunit 2 [Ascosphaera atra]|nr:Origin recognition complex subunit 2 [Ascosphaera atra]
MLRPLDCATLPIDEGTPAATEMTPKRKGRPKGTRNRRSPTPEGDIPAHERYFFQNRPGPVQTSDNTLRGLTLLTHEEYFEQMEKYADPHSSGKAFLFDLHARSFAQWEFELLENFSVCLYGYGSKRKLAHRFAEWLCERHQDPAHQPSIVVVNGYVSGTTVRGIFAAVVEAIFGPEDMPQKLGTQPAEVLELIRSSLEREPPLRPIIVLINSIDAPALRRPAYQAALARLASLPYINLLATADTPNFTLLWDISLRDQFNFVFHDCTTFEPYSTEEINVVDEVNTLLGRKVRRIGGRDGINFVLKSLPDNTRKLYRLLLTEILTVMAEQEGLSEEEGNGKADAGAGAGAEENAFVSWRTMYHKATEEFISSSEMMFRTQLKEFYDHQMIVSKTDVGGMELLGVPLLREEMESVLEELMME